MSYSIPSFAVVGHPNKGKSSIVSTLAQQENVEISERSGTTRKAESFTVTSSKGSYELIDTPGFQRPRQVLEWLKSHAENASNRKDAVLKFLTTEAMQETFPDEFELLRPIMAGADILYVVDGSRPYGPEYEAEMEILRWTGQPSMALINPIENDSHIEEWSNALGQFFKSVRVFNPMTAEFTKHVELLEIFAQLSPQWGQSLLEIREGLILDRQQKRKESANVLSRLLIELCQFRIERKVLLEKQAKSLEPIIKKEYQATLIRKEKNAIRELMALYSHYNSKLKLDALEFPPDLFDQEQWYAWGLNKKQLIAAAAVAGAVGGAAIDVALAGHSFLLGAIGGGLAGASSAFFGAEKLADITVKGLPLGGYKASFGPVQNRNFPYVLIGRFIFCQKQIAALNHANRADLNISAKDFQKAVESLEKSKQKELHKACAKLIKQQDVPELEDLLYRLLNDTVID